VICSFNSKNLPRSVEILQGNGARVKITLYDVEMNVPLAESCFCFDSKKNPQREVIDLR